MFPSLGLAKSIIFLAKVTFSLSLCVKFFNHLIILVALHWTISSSSRFLLNWEEQVWPQSGTSWQVCQLEWYNHFPWSIGSRIADVAQGMVFSCCCKSTLLLHVQLSACPDIFCRKWNGLYGQIQYKRYHLINTGGHSVGVNDAMLPQSITPRTLNVKCIMLVLLHYINYKLKEDPCGDKVKPSNIKQCVGFELPCLGPSLCLRQRFYAKIELWTYN